MYRGSPGLDHMSTRQALNVTWAHLVSKTKEERAGEQALYEALNNEFSVSSAASVSDMSADTKLSLLDSL